MIGAKKEERTMKKAWMFLIVMVGLMPLYAFAQQALPEVDPAQLIIQLVTNWKSMGPIAIGMAFVVLSGQAIKSFVAEDFKYKRLLVLVLSLAYGALFSVSQGKGVLEALVITFVTGGGAVALYEALKGVGIIKRPAPVALPASGEPGEKPAAPSQA